MLGQEKNPLFVLVIFFESKQEFEMLYEPLLSIALSITPIVIFGFVTTRIATVTEYSLTTSFL